MISKPKGTTLPMMKISSKLLNVIKKNSSFLIVGHVSPEGDSLGSSIALALGLKKMGKKDVFVLSKDPVPGNLKFLPSSRIVLQKLPRKTVDVVILVDCNEMKRTGFEVFNARKTAIIDHHVMPTNASKSEFYSSLSASHIDPAAAAAGVLIYKVLTALGVTIDKNIATNLYSAILVDTGGFKYSNVTAEPLLIASHLVEAGAKPWDISMAIYESVPYRSMKLLGLSLATIEKKDGIAWICTTKSMFKKTGSTTEDTEEFVNFPRRIKDVEVAIFFRESGNSTYKLSMRSKGKVNVQKVAKTFGGGGHKAAAGCTIEGSLEEVKNKVFRVISKMIKEN